MDPRPDYALDRSRLVSSAALLASSAGYLSAPTSTGLNHRAIPIPPSPLPAATSSSTPGLDSLYSAYHGRCASSSLSVSAGPSYSSLLSGCFDDAATPAVSPFRPPSSSMSSMSHLWPPVLPSDDGNSSCYLNKSCCSSSHFCICEPPPSTYPGFYDSCMGYARCGMNTGLYSVFSMVSGNDAAAPYYSRSLGSRLTSTQSPYQHLCDGSKGNDLLYSHGLQMRSMIPPPPPSQHVMPPSLAPLQCNSLAQMEFFTKRLETNSYCLPPSLPQVEYWRADEIRAAETSRAIDALSTNTTARKRDRHQHQHHYHHHHHKTKDIDSIKETTSSQSNNSIKTSIKHKEKLAVKKEVWPNWQTPVVTSIGTATVTTTTLTQTSSVTTVSTTSSSNKKTTPIPYDVSASPYIVTQPMGVVLDYSKKTKELTRDEETDPDDVDENISAFHNDASDTVKKENLISNNSCCNTQHFFERRKSIENENDAIGTVGTLNMSNNSTPVSENIEQNRTNTGNEVPGLVSGEKEVSSTQQQYVFEWEPSSRSQFSPTSSCLIQNQRSSTCNTSGSITPKTVIATIRSSPNSGLEEAPILHIPSPPISAISLSPSECKNNVEQTAPLALVTTSTTTPEDKPETASLNSSVASGSYHIPVGIAVARQRQEPSPSTGKHRSEDSVIIERKCSPSTSHRIRTFPENETKDVSKQISSSHDMSTSIVNSDVLPNSQWDDTVHNIPPTLPPAPPPPPWMSATQNSTYWLPQGSYTAATVPLSMQIGASIDPNHHPIPPVGYQLARDTITGHLLLIPTNIDIMDRTTTIWPTTYTSSTSQQLMIRQQILQQERSVEYRLDVPAHVETNKQIEDSEERNRNKTLAVAPLTQSPIMAATGIPVATYSFPTTHSYFYDTLSGSVMQLAQAVQTDTGRRSQGTSPAVPEECLMADGETHITYESDTGESGRDGTDPPPQVADASNQTETPLMTEDEEEIDKTSDIAVEESSDTECNVAINIAESKAQEWTGLQLLSNSIEEFEELDRMPKLDVAEGELVNNNAESSALLPPNDDDNKEAKPPDIVSEVSENGLSDEQVPDNVMGLAGLGLLCALAEQKYSEEKEKWKIDNRSLRKSLKDNNNKNFINNDQCVDQGMDSAELEMRMRLADLQKRYKEKQKELARLQPKKDCEKSPVKRGPGRPRKRKYSSGKSNMQQPFDNLVKTLVKLEASPPLLDTVLDEAPKKKKKKLKDGDSVLKNTNENEIKVKKPILKPALLNTEKLSTHTKNVQNAIVSENDSVVANQVSSMKVHIDLSKGEVKKENRACTVDGGNNKGVNSSHKKCKLLSSEMKKLEKKLKLHKMGSSGDVVNQKCQQMDGLGLLAQLVEEKCIKRKDVNGDASDEPPVKMANVENDERKRKPGRPKKHSKWKDKTETIVVKKYKKISKSSDFFLNEESKEKLKLKASNDDKEKAKHKPSSDEKEKIKHKTSSDDKEKLKNKTNTDEKEKPKHRTSEDKEKPKHKTSSDEKEKQKRKSNSDEKEKQKQKTNSDDKEKQKVKTTSEIKEKQKLKNHSDEKKKMKIKTHSDEKPKPEMKTNTEEKEKLKIKSEKTKIKHKTHSDEKRHLKQNTNMNETMTHKVSVTQKQPSTIPTPIKITSKPIEKTIPITLDYQTVTTTSFATTTMALTPKSPTSVITIFKTSSAPNRYTSTPPVFKTSNSQMSTCNLSKINKTNAESNHLSVTTTTTTTTAKISKIEDNNCTTPVSTATTTTTTIPVIKNSYLEDQAWNRRRSERIFLNDLNVVPCGGYSESYGRCPPQLKPATEESPTWKSKTDENLKPPKNLTRAPDIVKSKKKVKSCGDGKISEGVANVVCQDLHEPQEIGSLGSSKKIKKEKEKERKKRTKDRSVSEELFQALKDKCCLSDVNAVGVGGLSPRDSDSDNVESSSYSEGETLPLIQLVERPNTPEPRSAVIENDELVDKLRVLVLMDGLFYAGHVNAIQAPDVYGVALDGERGNRAHIYSREEILKEAFLEVKPGSVRRVPESSRVCAYWSQQYRCLYPGTVAKSPSPNPTDDKTTVYVEFDDGDSGKIPLSDIRLLPSTFPVISYDPSPLVYLGKRRSRSATDSSAPEIKVSTNGTNVSSSTDTETSAIKKSSKKKPDDENKSKKSKKCKDGTAKIEGTSSKPKKHKKHRDEHRHHHHRHHHKHKHRHDKHEKHSDSQQKDNFKIPVSTPTVNETVKPAPVVVSSSSPEKKKSELTVKIKTNSVDNIPTDISSVADDSETRSTWDSSECSKFSSPSELDKDSDDTSDEEYTISGKKSKKDENLRAKRRKERASVESKSKIAAFLPARHVWRWSGKSFKRPGTKGKAKKEFYKAITRGKETITVGDSAVFLSTGRPHLPYIGRIEMMWESWGGNMVVKVKWFYHPEETKGGRRLSDLKGALYESPHEDENDVQTISHKCEVLSWEQCKIRNSEAALTKHDSSLFDNNDVYYLAGYYDPTTGICSTEQGIC